MFVTTRSGKKEAVQFDKITHRIQKLTYGLDTFFVDPMEVAKKTIQGLFDGITTVPVNVGESIGALRSNAAC